MVCSTFAFGELDPLCRACTTATIYLMAHFQNRGSGIQDQQFLQVGSSYQVTCTLPDLTPIPVEAAILLTSDQFPNRDNLPLQSISSKD